MKRLLSKAQNYRPWNVISFITFSCPQSKIQVKSKGGLLFGIPQLQSKTQAVVNQRFVSSYSPLFPHFSTLAPVVPKKSGVRNLFFFDSLDHLYVAEKEKENNKEFESTNYSTSHKLSALFGINHIDTNFNQDHHQDQHQGEGTIMSNGDNKQGDMAYYVRGLHLFISSSVLVSFYFNRWKRDKVQKEMALYQIMSNSDNENTTTPSVTAASAVAIKRRTNGSLNSERNNSNNNIDNNNNQGSHHIQHIQNIQHSQQRNHPNLISNQGSLLSVNTNLNRSNPSLTSLSNIQSNPSSHASLSSLENRTPKRKSSTALISINSIADTLGVLGRGVGLGSSVDPVLKRSLTSSSRIGFQNDAVTNNKDIHNYGGSNLFPIMTEDNHNSDNYYESRERGENDSSYHNHNHEYLPYHRYPYQFPYQYNRISVQEQGIFNCPYPLRHVLGGGGDNHRKGFQFQSKTEILMAQRKRERLVKRLFSTSSVSFNSKRKNKGNTKAEESPPLTIRPITTKLKKSMVYTRTGDGGSSMLYNGERRNKDDYTFDALGAVDELNAHLGVAREYLLLSTYSFSVGSDLVEEQYLKEGPKIEGTADKNGNSKENTKKMKDEEEEEQQHQQQQQQQRVEDDDNDKDNENDDDESIDITNDLLERMIQHIQCRLHDMGASIATPPTSSKSSSKRLEYVKFDSRHLPKLEQWIDLLDANVPPLTKFIIPSGGLSASHLHVCRTVCRRAERVIVPLNRVAREKERLVLTLKKEKDVKGEGKENPDEDEASNEGENGEKDNDNHYHHHQDEDIIGVDPEVGKYLNRLSDFLFVASRVAAKNDGREESVWVKETFETSFDNSVKSTKLKRKKDDKTPDNEKVFDGDSDSGEMSENQREDF